ncbi:YoaK family protein [Nocardia crassostreae]|uniref:YoaK family protein n=1 Tax=Nocardia crassostreae TaxID=53428 RepID=UPI00082E6F0F|nr:YoaK family protein [Nocardia crassostreae]
MTSTGTEPTEPFWDLETRLSAALSMLAGFVGAAAYAHSAGYFVTFMTGNTERATVGAFLGDYTLARSAALLILCFVAGVIIASVCRRHLWTNHPHGATVLTTLALICAVIVDFVQEKQGVGIGLGPILLVAFGMGALNTSFVKNGEVSIPVSYVTGTLVKLAQGIERHMSGGSWRDWIGYAVQYGSFALGAVIGGLVSLVVDGPFMLDAAVVGSALVAAYTWRADIRWVRRQERRQADAG